MYGFTRRVHREYIDKIGDRWKVLRFHVTMRARSLRSTARTREFDEIFEKSEEGWLVYPNATGNAMKRCEIGIVFLPLVRSYVRFRSNWPTSRTKIKSFLSLVHYATSSSLVLER